MTVPDLSEDYAGAGFRGRLGFGTRPALLVVDVVRAYVDAGSPLRLPAPGPALEAVARLRAAARAAGAPTVLTRLDFRPDGSNAPLFFAKVPSLRLLADGSPYAQFCTEAVPGPGDRVVAKEHASAFFGTTLAPWLTARGVDTVLVAGFSTSGCVRSSAHDAMAHGFRPVVVREATADRDPAIERANLFDLDAKYADVVGLAEALSYLDGLRG